MPSSLTWLDHDADARERSLRILALFNEKESRDELGIGAIRDAFADRLFPGTSTIQTRLRYMLIIPWSCRRLEDLKVPASQFAARARQEELALVKPLLDAREEGVYGSRAQSDLKRLPSSVYWAGLGAWGIRRFPGSRQDYYQAVDGLYARRGKVQATSDDRRDKEDRHADPASTSWHPKLPPAPLDFPASVDLKLTAEEASFLVDCITKRCKDSLLAWLVLKGLPTTATEPSLHPQVLEFPAQIQVLLHHSRMFADVVEGAARLYNLSLADLAGNSGLANEHRDALGTWADRLDLHALDEWSTAQLWDHTVGAGHTITNGTRRFVEAWVDQVRVRRGDVADDAACRKLIEQRETGLKKARSRFTNRGALKLWRGYAGIGRLSYRWDTANRFLQDLNAAQVGAT